jgi:CubicO group peptidase (beta-lactamase class C family)
MSNGAYEPSRWEWEWRDPAEVGLDADAIAEAAAFSADHENTAMPYRLAEFYAARVAEDEWEAPIGPYRDRGATNGLITRGGHIVAEWGDTARVDMTFSVAKSYVATMAGVAWDAGYIRDFNDPVGDYVTDGTFDGDHNGQITWHHLLQQTSEWEGTLWEKPDLADRREGRERTLQTPGSFYEYNDVRVNLAAYSVLRALRRPLPVVLREQIMEPIGASQTWEWHGYDNSWITLDGLEVQSVSGGGHYGGGVWASTRDHARFGLLYLQRGRWGGRQLLSEAWIDRATTPGDVNPTYGYMWWLNPGHQLFPSAPESSFFALGFGRNVIWVDPEHDLLTVVRWTDADRFDEFIAKVLAAVRG